MKLSSVAEKIWDRINEINVHYQKGFISEESMRERVSELLHASFDVFKLITKEENEELWKMYFSIPFRSI